MIERILKKKLLSLSQQYPVVTLTGPRQSGKSTLLKNTFSDYQYVSLEDPDMRDFTKNDPRGFFKTYSNRVILDEIQRVPTLFRICKHMLMKLTPRECTYWPAHKISF